MPRRRRGIAAAIAMLFLVLFSMLALGFYASVTTSVQVAKNDRSNSLTLQASESAARFVRYHLSRVNVSGATPAAAFTNLYTALGARLNGQTNMGGHNISTGTDASGNSVIYVPGLTGANYNWMSLGTGTGSAQCRAVLTLNSSTGYIYLKGIGSDGGSSTALRAVQIKLLPQTSQFTIGAAGVVSKGAVTLSNGARISGGDVFSSAASGTVPLTMSGGTKIDQNFAYSTNSKTPSFTNGATVAGSIITNATYSFPTVDPSPFAGFVPTASAPVGAKVLNATSNPGANAVLTNIRVKANSNFSFGNAQVLNGVIYIEAPNKVSFGGAVKINGIIVCDPGTSLAACTLTIGNGVVMKPISTLVPANFAASEHIDQLLALNGALILSDANWAITLQGGTQAFDGAMVGGSFVISNGYTGQIRNGIISLSSTVFTMTGGGQITFVGGNTAIPGLTGGGSYYNLDPSSYAEVAP